MAYSFGHLKYFVYNTRFLRRPVELFPFIYLKNLLLYSFRFLAQDSQLTCGQIQADRLSHSVCLITGKCYQLTQWNLHPKLQASSQTQGNARV